MPNKMKSSSGKSGINAAAEPAIGEGEATPPVLFTVGIGASAGGYEPLEHIFATIPPDCELSFVVVMHLPSDGPRLLADLIRRYTSMEVLTIEDGTPLRPNTVHVIPPGRELTVSGGCFRLHVPEGEGRPSCPIARFFPPPPADAGRRAIAVSSQVTGRTAARGSSGSNRREGSSWSRIRYRPSTPPCRRTPLPLVRRTLSSR